MSFGLRRVGSAIHNLTVSDAEIEYKNSPEKLSFEFCIMYSDDDTIKDRDLKLYDFYKASLYTDVVLKVREESLGVHSIVLSSVSEYFQVMFNSEFRESSSRIIDFSSSFKNMAVLKVIVDYMYTGKISLRQQNFEYILGAAHLFLLNSLKGHCAQFLLEQLKPQNTLWSWQLAYLYNMVELEVVCNALLSSVFSRHLIDKTDVGRFTPDCLSALLNCEDLVQNMKPYDVAYLIIFWLRTGEFENRKEVAKGLLLKHLKEEALDATLGSITCFSYNLDKTNFELNSIVPNFDEKLHWGSSNDNRQKIEQGIAPFQRCSSQGDFHGLLVYEESRDGLNLFCQESNKWTYECIHGIESTPIGIIEDYYLVSTSNVNYTLHLTNLNTKTVEFPTPISESLILEERVINPEQESLHYFIHVGRLYALINLRVRSSSDNIFSIYQFDTANNWTLLLDIAQDLDKLILPASLSRNDIHVKLTSIPFDGNDIFIIAKFSLKKTVNSSGWDINQLNGQQQHFNGRQQQQQHFNGQQQHFNGQQQQLNGSGYQQVCYLYKVNLCQRTSTRISRSNQYLNNSQLDNAFFFKQRLFLPEEKFEEWELSGKLKIQCICYDLSSSNWHRENLNLPSPKVKPLPLKQKNFPWHSIKIQGCFLYAGVHQAPHVFNVYIFDFHKFQWQKCPPIPSASISRMSIYPLSAYRPVNLYLTNTSSEKQVDDSEFFFLNTLLESWSGDRAKLCL